MPEWELLSDRVVWISRRMGSQKALSERSGVAQRTVGDLARGKGNPTRATIQKLAEASGVDADWLFTGQGRPTSSLFEQFIELKETPEEVSEHDQAFQSAIANMVASEKARLQQSASSPSQAVDAAMVSLSRYAVQASAGDGAALVVEATDDVFTVPRGWIETIAPPGARLGIVEGRGDSMWPTIGDGDLLIVNFSIARRDLAAGGIFVFTWDGDIYCKRLAIDMATGDLVVISDNASLYEPQRIPAELAEEKLQLHCKVIRTIAPPRSR